MGTRVAETSRPVRLQPFTGASLAALIVAQVVLVVALVAGSSWVDSLGGSTTTLPGTGTASSAAGVSVTGAGTTAPGDAGTAVDERTRPPEVDAAAYLVVDADGEVLAEQAADERRPIGSITKLMTARVVMEAGDLGDTAGVPELDPDSEEARIGLEPGTLYRRDVLLRAMLIVSAGDAARALAVDVAGSQEAFAGMMNDEAAELGLDGTHFVGPVGMPHPDHYSTARDVATLATLLMQDETFRSTVSRRDATLHGRTLPATNDLLGSYLGADGIKTGHTDEAGWCIAASATRDGRRVVAIVLGSSSREGRNAAATALLDWAFTR